VTNALSLPSGGIISGQGAFLNLFGSSPREMALVPEAVLMVEFPRIGGGGFGFGATEHYARSDHATRSAD
jgi:hypothetical protein